MTHHLLRLLIAFALLVPVWGITADQRDAEIKALFLYNFANFVEWPPSAYESANAPLRMCLYGQVLFSPQLDPFEGTLIGAHRLELVRSETLAGLGDHCHMLFVGEDRRAELPTFFNQVNYLYILSVGEQNDFAEQGGVINIFRTTDRLTFDINLSAADANELQISSDLLALARTVRRYTGNGSLEVVTP